LGGRLISSRSEGGHADFAPRTEREIELMRDLIARVGRAESGAEAGNLALRTMSTQVGAAVYAAGL
jgi:glucokinase